MSVRYKSKNRDNKEGEAPTPIPTICYRGDDAEGKQMEAHYEAVSTDGGETWELELAGQEEMRFVPLE